MRDFLRNVVVKLKIGAPERCVSCRMLINHRSFEIEISSARQTPLGEFTCAWAAYRTPREPSDGPEIVGTTISFLEREVAEEMAKSDSCHAVNDLLE